MEKESKEIQTLIAEALLEPAERLKNLLSEEIYGEEDIHGMRVASRRLRTGLDVFGAFFDEHDLKKWMRDLKALTESLGSARDHDVFISFLKECGVPEQIICIEEEQRREAYAQAEKSIGRAKSTEKISSRIAADSALNVYSLGAANVTVRCSTVRKCSLSLNDRQDVQGHHRMRIAVKKLRYTLEIFAPLFDDRLSPEIRKMKDLQDSLGKMHDCDIFSEKILMLMNECLRRGIEITSVKTSLENKCCEIRNKEYDKACAAWSDLEKNFFFSLLSAKFKNRNALSMSAEKIAVISDIHGNLPMLKAAAEDALSRGAEAFLCLGDVSAGKGDVASCLEFLQELNAVCIHGNYDVKTLEGQWGAMLLGDTAALKIPAETADALVMLPSELRINAHNKTLLMTHDSPGGGKERLHRSTDPRRLAYLAEMSGADCILIGHSHIPFIRRVNGTLFINPGSIGKPRDCDLRPSYALLNASDSSAEIIKFDGDSSESVPQYTLEDSVSEADHGIIDVYWGMEEVLKTAEDVGVCIEHALAVSRNASALFCCLVSLHGLQERELELLQQAAVLHDAGLLFGQSKHAKRSYEIICDLDLHLDADEQEIVARTAEYHSRKPKRSDLEDVPESDAVKILKLASLLRIADEIADKTSAGIADCSVENSRVTILLNKKCDLKLRKDDLFRKTFGCRVDIA